MTGKRSFHPYCIIVMLTIFLIASQASALLTADDVANQVKAALVGGATVENAVKSVVASAIAQGMSAKDAAAAAAKSAVAAAFTSDQDLNAAIRGAVIGAANGALAAGQDANAALEGACQGVISAAADADIQLAAWMAVGACVSHAVQHNQDSALAASAGVTGTINGAVESGLSSKEIATVVSGSVKGAIAKAIVTGQDTRAMATAVQGSVYLAAESHGLDPANLTMTAAAAASIADTLPPGAQPRKRTPSRGAPDGPYMPAPESDPIEPVPDPTASGV